MQKNGRKITMEELRANGTVIKCKDCSQEVDSHWLRNGPNDYPLMDKCAPCFFGDK